jgi:hypothetical protein
MVASILRQKIARVRRDPSIESRRVHSCGIAIFVWPSIRIGLLSRALFSDITPVATHLIAGARERVGWVIAMGYICMRGIPGSDKERAT